MVKVNEIWLPIPSYEEYYEVSDLGNVRSLDRIVPGKVRKRKIKGRTLRPNFDLEGYTSVQICKNSIPIRVKIHRIVCLVFNGDPLPEQIQVNHKNNIKSDNRAVNLEWCTQSENITHNWVCGFRKVRFKKLSAEKLAEIIKDKRTHTAIAVDYGVSQSTISKHKKKACPL